MTKIRIAIFEDNSDLLDSLSLIIEPVDEFELVGAFPGRFCEPRRAYLTSITA